MSVHRSGWTTEADPERALARRAKDAGMWRTEYLVTRINAVHEQAKLGGWSHDRLAQAVDDIEQLANEMWGKL